VGAVELLADFIDDIGPPLRLAALRLLAGLRTQKGVDVCRELPVMLEQEAMGRVGV